MTTVIRAVRREGGSILFFLLLIALTVLF